MCEKGKFIHELRDTHFHLINDVIKAVHGENVFTVCKEQLTKGWFNYEYKIKIKKANNTYIDKNNNVIYFIRGL